MAGHPLNYEPYPEVMPQGGPEARENIHTDPDMFGAAIGRGLSTLGQGIEHADNAGFDVATMQAKQDAQTHANELHSWQSDQVTNLQENFLKLRGKDAEMALPDFKQKIEDFHRQAREQAGNPFTAQLVDSEGRRLTDAAYAQSARHAAQQKSVWDTNTADDAAASHGSRAALGATTTPGDVAINANPSVVISLAKSDDAARQAAQLKGLDGDIEAQRNRGKNVATIVKSLLADGSYTSLHRAAEFLGSQDSKIDGGSRATIEQALKAHEAQYNGQYVADAYMGRGTNLPPGYAQRTFQVESGGNPNAQSGSHGGLGQFSKAIEQRYGINDRNRTDPAVQTRALSMENAENHDALTRALGHEPTPADYYLAHQQGVGGAVAHITQPNLPAWQNMLSTGEGHEKGAGWAKQAIWGNMTPDMKAQFPGGVETVTSGDFARMWAQRFYDQPIQALGTLPGNGNPAQAAQNAAFGFNRFAGAQDFSEANKGEVIKRITNDPRLLDHPQAMNAAITYTHKIFEAQNASYADMERQRHLEEQQKKMVSEEAENNYLKQIYAPAAGAKPLNSQAIVLDDRLSRESKDRIIKLIGDPGEKDERTYGSGFVKAFQMVHAPAGTQGRITDVNELYPRLGPSGDLTMAGVEKLRGEIELKKSPEGNAEAQLKKAFTDFAFAHISGTDLGMNTKDPKGEELYLKFMAQWMPAYDAARRAGKSPGQLLDPNSPDYLAKGMLETGHGFVRPMNVWFNDLITDAPPSAQSKSAFDIKTVKNLGDLVEAYRAGHVTKQQADEMAINQGWAARKAKIAAPISQ
jgi:hypothetical protein